MAELFPGRSKVVLAVVIAFVMAVPVSLLVGTSKNAELAPSSIDDGNGLTGHDVSISGSPMTAGPRTVDYRWYDVFNVSFGPWYPQRTLYYPGADCEQVWSNTYPYIYEYWGDSMHQNLYLYSNLRLNITARNLPEVNTNHPVFLPLFGTTTGGNATLNWHMQYMDPAWVIYTYGSAAMMYNDGWFVNLTGVTTLDKDAAMAVMGMTSSQFDNFDTYWATNRISLRDAWMMWLAEDQANGLFDINNMYSTPMQIIGFGLHALKVGDKLVLTVYVDSWGMEALMARWLRSAFMPTEIWMEGFWMNATIGPQTSNIFIKTDVEYGVHAFTSRADGNPIWLWRPLHADYFVSSGDHPKSEFDPYALTINPDTGQPYTYKNWNPGSALYGTNVSYDVTPCVWNLSDNETISFTWPAGMQQFELDAGPGLVTNLSSNMTISYAEPMPGDHSSTYLTNGSIALDATSRTLKYTGPIDFWHWSQTQNAPNHQVLKQQWIDINGVMLPESAPWVEYGMASSLPPPQVDHFVISGMDDLPVVGQQTSLTVTAFDQYGVVMNAYVGTVHFSSNRSSSVTLPADYQFTAGDHGVKTFTNTITFNAAGWYTVTVNDVATISATGSYTDIMAIPTPQVIDHFTIQMQADVSALSRVDVTVTAWNQYGRIFHEYTGTVSLTTNASAGTYSLPGNYAFLSSEGGVHTFQGGVTWNMAGVYRLNVRDTIVTTASGTVTNILVTSATAIHYKIYNMFQDHWMPFWKWRYKAYGTDIILTDTPGNYTMLYNPDKIGYQGIIWAPYRMNIDATNITNINVHHPEFMPVLDSNHTFAGANATVNVYFQYLYWEWWNSTWVPRWSMDPNWYPNSMTQQTSDGWYLGVQYNVTMNREAAQEWLRLPTTTTNVAAWWAANASSFKHDWKVWLLNELNNRSDIYNAYEFPGAVTGPYASLTELPNGDVRLELDHVSWGYEVLMNRWLMEKRICTHQPYLENFTMSAMLDNERTNLTLDTVCQWSLHAVKANQSTNGSAWAFEPIRQDYIPSSPNHPNSTYDPYVGLTYMSWNAGDPWFGTENSYDSTPGWFNLTKSQTLVIEVPRHDQVIAYEGRGVGDQAINNITYGGYPNGGDFGDYNKLIHHGSMSLGFYITSLNPAVPPLDLNSMYDPVSKMLTIDGPYNFDNSGRGFGAPMYHGAPWIEFNVTPPFADHPPVLTSHPSNKKMWQGNSTSFSVAALDQDREALRYTWSFGDGTWLVGPTNTTHTYAKAGMYTFTVYADDLTGLAGHNVSSTATASVAFNLPLWDGWNLISVPLAGNGYKASTLGLADGSMVAGWNSTRQVYDQTYIVGISESTDDFAIADSASYLVWVASAKTLHLYGSVQTTMQSRTFTVPSSGGWVMMGFESQVTTRKASDVVGMYSGPGALTSVAYDPPGYIIFDVNDAPPFDFALIPGQGYWCWVTSSGTLSYMP